MPIQKTLQIGLHRWNRRHQLHDHSSADGTSITTTTPIAIRDLAHRGSHRLQQAHDPAEEPIRQADRLSATTQPCASSASTSSIGRPSAVGTYEIAALFTWRARHASARVRRNCHRSSTALRAAARVGIEGGRGPYIARLRIEHVNWP